jgi:hypothetical protein
MTPDGYNRLVLTRYKAQRGSSERRAWRWLPPPSFFLFFLSLRVSRVSIHSFLLQASLELAPQHDDDASSLASTCNHQAAIHTFIVSQKKRIKFTLSFFVFSMTQIPNQVIAFLNETWNL